jgi:hypothetical protein
MDDEGNLIVYHCSKELFDQIITSIQLNYWRNLPLVLYLTEETKDQFEEALDYLQIHHFERYNLVNT